MSHLRTLFIVSIAMLAMAPAFAQAPNAQDPLSDDKVRELINVGLDNMTRLRCSNGPQPFCAPATAEERANPPVSIAEGRAVMRRALLSGLAVHCKLDWQNRNFLPMMNYWRRTVGKSERQMSLFGFIHGVTQRQVENALAGQPCSDEMRRNVDSGLTFRP